MWPSDRMPPACRSHHITHSLPANPHGTNCSPPTLTRRRRRKPTTRSPNSPAVMAASLWRAVMDSVSGSSSSPSALDAAPVGGVEFWHGAERAGWLNKQGEYIKTWRRRWFVLKQGRLFWFKDPAVTRASVPRGVIPVASCLTVKGAEDVLNRQFAFELSTPAETMYFIADSEKEKEEWINSIGRSIVQHSRSVTDAEVVDYDSRPQLPPQPKASEESEPAA